MKLDCPEKMTCVWLRMSVKMSFELFREFIMKLFIFSNKLSTKLNSETKFYVDFKLLTFGQLIKKTL